jgi:uncharacterized protein (TIGR03435 family)
MTSLVLVARAQSPAFEAAVIKPTAVDPDTIPSFKTDPGRIAYINVTLRDCIKIAWNLRDIQIEAPKTIDAFRFDLTATAGGATTDDQMRGMLRNLLVERFKMKLHQETKELPAYALAASGKTKLTPSAPNSTFTKNFSLGKLSWTHATMGQFAEVLSGYTNRYVIDQTGLTGAYDFSLIVSDDPLDAKRIMRGNELGDMIVATIQSQLGLRLESRKSPIPVLIVDQAEKTPSDN